MSLIKVSWYVLRAEIMHSWSPMGSMRQGKSRSLHYNTSGGKAQLCNLTSVFQHLPSVGSEQFCELAHLGCTREGSTFLLSVFSNRKSNTFATRESAFQFHNLFLNLSNNSITLPKRYGKKMKYLPLQ